MKTPTPHATSSALFSRRLALGAITATLMTFATSPSAASDQQAWQQMVEQYYAATREQADLDQVTDAFTDWQTEHPGDHMAKMYLGALLCLQGRDAWMPWNKVKYVNQCLDQMDDAVDTITAEAPELLDRALLERGFVTASLPGMFNRTDTALEDFAHVRSAPLWTQLSKPIQQRVNDEMVRLQAILDQGQEN